MTAPAAYIGRVFDVLAFRGATATGEVQLDQTLFGDFTGGAVCTGIQKLSQQWLIEFLTIRGSIRFYPDRGTYFMQAVHAGSIRHEVDAQSEFLYAATLARQALINAEDDTVPDDERIDEAELTRLVLNAGTLELYITITSVAGESRAVILPINIVPTNLNL